MHNNRTTESLLARRALAEKAAKGDWYMFRLTHPSDHFNVRASFSAANVEQICQCNAPTDANQANATHIAANSPDVVMDDINEILRLRAQVERLEKEADWLAEYCWKKPEAEYHPLREMRGGFYCGTCPHDHDCRKCWREAARKAVEEMK